MNVSVAGEKNKITQHRVWDEFELSRLYKKSSILSAHLN